VALCRWWLRLKWLRIDPGVSVDALGSRFMHRAPIAYPRDARLAGIEGNVVVGISPRMPQTARDR
jgi:hypothetical protein